MVSHSDGPAASTVMSRISVVSEACTRSTAPMTPPARPIAEATCPSMPGLWSISTRIVREYWAEGVVGTP
jgi:hypothetical protein